MAARIDTPQSRRAVAVTAAVLVLLFGLYRVLRLDAFPVLTNDSMSYMERSLEYTSFNGIAHSRTVVRGFKYAGYPIFIAICRGVSGLVGSDPLTTIVVVQRLLFVAAIVMSVRLLGLFALPVVYMLSGPSIVCFSNYVLTEGITIPLAVLYAGSLLLLDRGPRPLRCVGLSLCAAVSLVFMVMSKLPYALFALPWIVVAVRAGLPARGRILSHPALAMVVAGAILAGFIVHASLINKREFGRFFPTVNTGMALYWSAHYSVFKLRPQNRKVAELRGAFAKGNCYPRIYEVVREYPGLESSDILHDEARELLRKAGISYHLETLRSAGYAMVGGEKQELKGSLPKVLEHNGAGGFLGRPAPIRQMGEQAWLEKYNADRTPATVPGLSRGPIAPGNETRVQRWLWVILLAAVAVLVAVRRTGWTALAMCVSVVIFCALVGHMLADIWRYMLTPGMMLAVAGSWSIKELACGRR